MKKYLIVTYGCQMNVHESEKIAGILENMGYLSCQNREDADIIVFNTCAIREGACDRAFGNIGALKSLKASKKDLLICVVGCMTQKESIAETIYKKFPFIDIILGTFNLEHLGKFILAKQKVKEILSEGEISEGAVYARTSGDNAWVNIMYGCNNFCAYCIVPYVRGREKSRDKKEILKEISELVSENKYKTITLLGQNVNSYGNDSEKNGTFVELLKEITKIEGDFKVTFMTSHPKDLKSEVIDEIAINDKLLKSIHLPMQSGSNRILNLMNRRYTREKYLQIAEEIRRKIPNCNFSSDFIVGFPTETEEDFNETLSVVSEVKFNVIFAYMYSSRGGTVASTMEGQIEEKIKNRRVNELLALQKKIQKERKNVKRS